MKQGRREFLSRSMVSAGAVVAGSVGPLGASEEGPRDSARLSTSEFLEAVREGNVERVRGGLAADPGLLHSRDEAGRSAFALALIGRHARVAELLRQRGHQPDLHESALALDWERFEPLAEEAPSAVNRDHPIGGTAMFAAALGGAGTQMWRVYRFGGLPNLAPRGPGGYTAVRAALEHPDLAVAELTAASLLGNGAAPGGPQIDGSSPLHAAARRGSVDLVELLLRKGADVGALDDRGRTALDLAEESKQHAAAGVLRRPREVPRDHSSSRDAYDVDGNRYAPPDLGAFSDLATGEVVGQSHRDLDAVRRAVEAHPELAHSQATTTERAVEAGAHMGRTDIVDYLLGHGAPCSLPTAVMRNDLTRARALLEEDPLRINERGPHDFALLWYPVIGRGLVEMAQLLLDHGADVERQHWLGTTALHYAALGGDVELARLLLDHGADPSRVGRKFGMTPVQIAQARGHDDLARLLRDHGGRG